MMKSLASFNEKSSLFALEPFHCSSGWESRASWGRFDSLPDYDSFYLSDSLGGHRSLQAYVMDNRLFQSLWPFPYELSGL